MHDVEAKFHTPIKSIEFASNTGAVNDKCIAALPPLDTNVYFINHELYKDTFDEAAASRARDASCSHTKDAFKASLAVHSRGGGLQAGLVP